MALLKKVIVGKAALAIVLPLTAGTAFAAAQDVEAGGANPATAEAAPAQPATVDTNNDGKADAWDRDGNGAPDAWDTNGDGKPDKFDDDGDGKPDKAAR